MPRSSQSVQKVWNAGWFQQRPGTRFPWEQRPFGISISLGPERLCQGLENQPRFPLSMESLVRGQVQSQGFQDHMLGPATFFWIWREKGGKQGRTTAFVWGDDNIFFFQAAVSLENGFRKPHMLGGWICWDSEFQLRKTPLLRRHVLNISGVGLAGYLTQIKQGQESIFLLLTLHSNSSVQPSLSAHPHVKAWRIQALIQLG